MRIGEDYFFAVREDYLPELAAVFRDNELRSDGYHEYVVAVRIMRERLDLLGFSNELAQSRIWDAYDQEGTDVAGETFECWIRDFRAGKEADIPSWVAYKVDPRLILRAILEVWPESDEIALDLSELVSRGYIDATADLCAKAFRDAHGQAARLSPLIVLTEGSTDSEFLQDALAVLYPHLVGYMTFLDSGYRTEGGIAGLIKTIRSFAAAGIGNRVVALVDNDTGAAEALSTFNTESLPSNFRVVRLPELPMAVSYPTLGPSGPANLNINGLACSIELFFGRDILAGEDGRLMPIQWRGYSMKLQRYQGEPVNKTLLQDAFRKRARRAREREKPEDGEDWEGMRLILDSVRSAFA